MTLVAFLDIMHLGVTLTVFAFGGIRSGDRRGIHYGAALEQQAVAGQFCIDDLQDLRA